MSALFTLQLRENAQWKKSDRVSTTIDKLYGGQTVQIFKSDVSTF